MKVILLAPTPPPAGGIASWTIRMLSSNFGDRWSVDVVDEKVSGGRQIFGSKKKRNFLVEIIRTIRIWSDLNKKLDSDVKVVHSNIPAGLNSMLREIGCMIISKLKKKRFIVHYRCTIPNMIKSKISMVIFQILSNGSDAIIVLNRASQDFSKQHSKTPSYLIPNFIESIGQNKNKHINQSLKRAVYVGGVIREKGCLEIIEASKSFPDIEFRLIGRAADEILNQAKTHNVILLGELSKNDVEKELEEADLFLFPSYFPGEGFSNALLEAMAKGLPCIVSDWAANPDMVEENGGCVIPIKNIQELVKAINSILPYNKRYEMSVWNKNKVNACYTDEIIIHKYIELYERIIGSQIN